MQTIKKSLVLGFGHWGKAISFVLLKQGFKVTTWARSNKTFDLSAVQKKQYKHIDARMHLKITDLKNASDIYDYVFLTLPSGVYEDVFKLNALSAIIKKNHKNIVMVNCSKGIQFPTLKTVKDRVFSSFTGLSEKQYAVISGPGFSDEILKQTPTALVVASANLKLRNQLQTELMNPMLRLYTSGDVLGVELAGSLKNVLAIVLGLCHGLKFGINTKAAVLTRGMHEISRLGTCLGAKQRTFWGLAGIGDLFLTATSMQSRNYKLGYLLGKGKPLAMCVREIAQTIEGLETVRAAYKLAEKNKVEMPITENMYRILWEGLPVDEAINSILNRLPKDEAD